MDHEARLLRVERETRIPIAVQVDGRTIGTFQSPLGSDAAAERPSRVLAAMAMAQLAPEEIARTVYVPDRLVGLWTPHHRQRSKRSDDRGGVNE